MTDELTLPDVMSLAAAAERLGVSERTIKRGIDHGELRASQLAERGCWVIRREDLLAWLDARANMTARPITPLPAGRDAARAATNIRRRSAGRSGPLSAKLRDMGDKAA